MVFSERVTYDISLMLSLSRKISHHNVHTCSHYVIVFGRGLCEHCSNEVDLKEIRYFSPLSI